MKPLYYRPLGYIIECSLERTTIHRDCDESGLESLALSAFLDLISQLSWKGQLVYNNIHSRFRLS